MRLTAIALLLSAMSTSVLADEFLRLYRKAEASLEVAVDHGHRCKEEIRAKGEEQDDCETFAGAAVGWRAASRELRATVDMRSDRLLRRLHDGDIDNYYRLLDELNSILDYLEAHREAVR